MGRHAVVDPQPRTRAPDKQQQRFNELGLIGEGSYGVVVKARDRQSGRLVALKKFFDSTIDSTTQREMEALRRLSGTPGVCALVASYTDAQAGGRLRIAMEFVGGGSLLEQLKAHPRGLPWTRARAIVRSLCEAVGDMHARGVMHRDLKPENVLLCDRGGAQVKFAFDPRMFRHYLVLTDYTNYVLPYSLLLTTYHLLLAGEAL